VRARARRSAGSWVVAIAILAALAFIVPAGAGNPAATASPLANPGGYRATPAFERVAAGFSPGSDVQDLGPLPSGTTLTVLVGLPSRDPGGFAAYDAAAYIPGTGAYHRFLSPGQVASQFGAAASAVTPLEDYFGDFGLRTSESPDGLLLTISGTSAALASAFGTSFELYRDAGGRTFFSHPTPAVLPGGLSVSGAFGLGNVTPLSPLDLSEEPSTERAVPTAGCSSGSGGLTPCQIWGAYDSAGLIANGTNGTGERIGVVDTYDAGEGQDQLESDLGTFDSLFGLPNPTVSYNYPVPTVQDLNSTYSGWGTEEALDLEWSHASAPGASIAMTFAPNSGVGLYLAVDWLVSHHLVDVISLSWGEPDTGIFNAYSGPCSSECNATSDGSYEVLSPVLQAAAVEGIGVFVATGDCGASDGTSGVSTDYPASDPSADAVGGTYLSVSSSGVYQSETGWSGNSTGAHSPGCQNQGGSGGGFSPFPRPYWQSGTGVPASPATRATPDVSADASDGVAFVMGGGQGTVGGTSLATPVWAGFAAIADQYAGHELGQLSPAVYAVLRSTNYSTDFHDVTSGNNGYQAGVGWDAVTGVGTPIVGQLVKALVRPLPSASTLRVLLYSNQTYGPAPLSVKFAVAPSGGAAPYPLEGVYFGDGTSALASGGIVTHTFSHAGVYAAVAFAADSSGNLTSSIPVAVVVGGGGPLNVSLVPSSGTPPVDGAVTFTAEVQGGTSPYQYVYSFGDGTFLNLSAAGTVTHAYEISGGFCADVIVEDSANPADGARSAPVPIAVGGATVPACSNASEPLTVAVGASPGIRDAPADFPSLFSVGGGVGGTTETLASSDPYVAACECTLFRSPGNFSVALTATDAVGDRTTNETNVSVAPPLRATFTATPTFGDAPLTVALGVTVRGGYLPEPNLTHWYFGDGTGATGSDVQHTFTTPGFYSVTGDATDRGQGNASEGFLVDVLPSGDTTTPALTATFAPAVNIASGATIRFAAQTSYLNGSAAPAAIHWDLGENSSAWGASVSQTYYSGAPGLLNFLYATVTAEWAEGSPSTEATLITPQLLADETDGFVPAVDALHLAAAGNPSSGSPGLLWGGTASVAAPGAVSVNWTFGDGRSATGSAVNHTFLTSGDFTVNANASDTWGDTAYANFGVAIGPGVAPTLAVEGGPSSEAGTAPLTVSFDASVTGGAVPYTYAWTTGDGGTNSNATFQHLYLGPGTFTARLNVTDGDGNSVELNWTIVVSALVVGGEHVAGPSGLVVYVLIGAVVVAVAAVSAVLFARRRPPPTP
jgi:PKD repeat protein